MAIMNSHDVSNHSITSKIEATRVQGNHDAQGRRTAPYRAGQWVPPGGGHSGPSVGYSALYAQNFAQTFRR